MLTPTSVRRLRRWPGLFLALLACLSMLMFYGTAQAAALPLATLNVPSNVLVGENFSFTVTFDNTSPDTGYGPFVDLVFPATGADGDDGITFSGATYLGQPVTAVSLTFPAGGCVAHPYAEDTTHAPLQVCGAWVVSSA